MGRTVSVKLMAEVASFTRPLGQAVGSVRALNGELDKAARAGKLDHVADQAARFGLVGVAAFGYIAKSAADFDKQMSAVSAATHASAAEMMNLREAALAAGKSTQFSATQAAQGVTELAKAGVSTTNILSGGLKGSLDLAAAGQLSVGEAAETAASAMTQFKLKGDQIPHVADLLAAAAGKAQGSVHDMGAALNQSGLVAAQTGLTIEETTGTLAAFASAGLTGSDAGTSFKQMLLQLQAPSEISAGLMRELGISAYDTAGQFIGITKLAQVLRDKLSGLTQEERAHAMAQIFGADATRTASILYENGAVGLQKWIDKTNDAGYAQQTAAELTNNLAGDIERLKGSLETMAIEAGSGANGGLRSLTKGLNALVDGFGQLPPIVSSGLTVLAGVGGVLALGVAGWIKTRQGIASAVEQLNAVGPAGEKAAVGLQKGAAAAGKLGAAFLALQVAGAVISSFQTELNPQIDAAAKGLEEWARQCLLSGEAARLFGDDSQDLDRSLNALSGHGFSHATDGVTDFILGLGGVTSPLDEAKTQVDALDQTLATMARNGHAADALGYLEERAKATGHSVDDLKKLLPAFSGAMETSGTTAETTGGSLKDVGAAADTSAKELKQMQDAFEDLYKATMSADQAAIKYESALVETNKELEKGRRTLSLHSEEGRKNRTSVLSEVEAIEDLRAATVKQGGSISDADKKYRTQLETLRKHLLALGYDKDAVNDLINKYKGIPKSVDTKMSISGYDAVKGKLDRLAAYQQGLKAGTIKPGQFGPYRGADGKYFADGGWTGPGHAHEEAGVVHADEFVIKKSSRRKIEQRSPGLLDEMNATGQVPGYAGGGRVGWPFPVNVAGAKIPSRAAVAAAVMPSFGSWPSSPGAQRGDSGVWRSIVAMIRATGPMSGSFGNGYRAGDPLWHGSGRAVDWMGFNQDRLASFLAGRHPLELIHRTNSRDYAYTRGVNKGSFNSSLMNAHRNHVHIAMAGGGVIREPVFGIGASGTTYAFGEGGRPETVTPGVGGSPASGSAVTKTMTFAPVIHINGSNLTPQQIAVMVNREIGTQIDYYARGV